MHRARQFYLKVHRTSVTCDVMRRRRANTRPRGRGNAEVEVEVNLCDVSKDVMLSQDRHMEGVDFFDTCAPVVNWNTVRLL